MLPRAPCRKDLLATHGTGGSAVSSLKICRRLPHLTSCPSPGTLHPATESGGSIQAQPFLLAAGRSDSRQPLLSSHQGFVEPVSLTDFSFYSLPLPSFSLHRYWTLITSCTPNSISTSPYRKPILWQTGIKISTSRGYCVKAKWDVYVVPSIMPGTLTKHDKCLFLFS